MKILKNQKEINKLKEEWLVSKGYIDPITKLVMNKPIIDHDHITHKCRGLLNFDTNQFEGKVSSAYNRFLKHKEGVPCLQEILMNLIKYLNQNVDNNPLHMSYIKQKINKFKILKKELQDQILIENNIEPGKTKKDNLKLYKKLINENS